MDAVNPLRRRLCAVGLVAAFLGGCQTAPAARGQAPVPPPDAPTPGYPVNGPPAPVEPVTYAPAATDPATLPFDPAEKPRIKVVAIVGQGNIITDDEVQQAVRQRMNDYIKLPPGDREVRESEIYRFELKRIIERELIVDDMLTKLKKNKPGMIEEIKEYAGKQADRRLKDARKANGLSTDQEFQDKVLSMTGLTLPVLRRQIERSAIMAEYIQSMVKEKRKMIGLGDIHEFYVRNPEKFRIDDRVKWLDLFVSVAKFPSAADAFRHAESLRQQAAAGADFVALVKQYDHGDATFRNGDGVGQKAGEIRPVELEPVLWQLKKGEVGPVVPVPAGYHVVKAVEREYAGIHPLDEKTQTRIREMIFDQIVEQEVRRLLDDLWRKGSVQIIDVP